MKPSMHSFLIAFVGWALSPSLVHAEILAMLNYEAKPEQILRKEGLAIIDVDPTSPTFRKMLLNNPLPPDLVAHRIFYNFSKQNVREKERSD